MPADVRPADVRAVDARPAEIRTLATPPGDALFQMMLRVGDDHLVMGHRISEWCGHAPMLEEDLALPNIALDLIGQARGLLTYAGELEDKGRSEDDLAYFRTDRQYRNCLLVERPNGDFGHTMLKILYFSAFMEPWWRAACASPDEALAGIAGKAVKEAAYHVRHSAEWVIRLGDGTEESASRMAAAVAALHGYTPELFEVDDVVASLVARGVVPDPEALRADWQRTIDGVFAEALLDVPQVPYPRTGGRQGMHGEELGHMLAQMQALPRQMPGQAW
ncbi:MAG: 1,2-phenylacetyl-CoA epoxidase subunit PaaC [Pseudomonadota bacterium]